RTGDPRDRAENDASRARSLVYRQIILPAAIAAVFLTVSIRWFIWQIGAWVDRSRAGAAESTLSFWSAVRGLLNCYFELPIFTVGLVHAGVAGLIGGVCTWLLRGRQATARQVVGGFLAGVVVGLGVFALELLTWHVLWDYTLDHLGLLEPPNFVLHMGVF